jgi:hypothetical protein
MSHPLVRALVILCATCLPASAVADDYAIMIGVPPTGSSIPPGRVGLGIRVGIDKSWEQLTPPEQQVWREFTELTDPDVTPPFPLPNIRAFLRKLTTPDKFNYTDSIEHREALFLIVRVSETGVVTKVDIMEGTNGAKSLSDNDKLLAYRYITALLATTFSPAMYKGQPSPSAFPLLIGQRIRMR